MISTIEYLTLYQNNPWYSKDYDDTTDQREIDKEKIREYNKNLIVKYPWLLPRNYQIDEIYEDYDWDYSILDDMPDGWRITFGDQMCQEIQCVLDKYPEQKDKFRIVQLKEKFGFLRCYVQNDPDGIQEIIDKYSRLSGEICIRCGKPATWISTGWICPWCDDCKETIEGELVPIEKWYGEDCSDTCDCRG